MIIPTFVLQFPVAPIDLRRNIKKKKIYLKVVVVTKTVQLSEPHFSEQMQE